MVVGYWQRRAWWPGLCLAPAQRAVEQRDFDLAKTWLGRVEWLVDDDYRVAILNSRIARKQGEMKAVAGFLDLAAKQGATPEQLQREHWFAQAQSGQMRLAGPHLSQLLQDPDADPNEVCEAYVLGFTRNRRFDEALTLLQAWIADSPQAFYPLQLRGRIQMVLENLDLAEVDLRQSIALNPDDTTSNSQLGIVLEKLNRPAEAIPFLEKCKDDVLARTHLAVCRKKTGDSERCLIDLQAIVAEFPDNLEAVRELGRSQMELGNYEDAVVILRRAVEIADHDDESHYVLAQTLQMSGQPEEAALHFERVKRIREAMSRLDLVKSKLDADPRDLEKLIECGELLLKYSTPQEGVIWLLAALDVDPKNERVHRLLFDYYSKRSAEDPKFHDLAEQHRRLMAGD
jgi:tetratricopeptide (TPR) repeat protein